MSVQALQDYTFTSKYARYLKDKKRRETWDEAVDRVRDMHIRKYPQIKSEIEWAFEQSRQKRVLGSQRALQFGGPPIEKNNARLFNCIASYADRLRFFQECFWLLLCGCGTGFSVQKHHIAKLPNFSPACYKSKKPKVFQIPDTIEGWADAAGVLMSSYFGGGDFPEYEGFRVLFDYGLIRPEGSPLSSSSGKAPGPEPLRRSLEKVEDLLQRCIRDGQTRLRSIDAYDIVMHFSDAVLSGGVRRSATICLFSPDDMDMAMAKTGNWFQTNPQRGRSNNSAILIRDETSKQDFEKLMGFVKEYGEPGFVWADSNELVVNPCVTKETLVMTGQGLQTVESLVGKQFMAYVEGDLYQTTSKGFWETGTKEVFKLQFLSGRTLRCTANHQILTTNGWKNAIELDHSDKVVIHNHKKSQIVIDSKSDDFNKGHNLGSLIGLNPFQSPRELSEKLVEGSFPYLSGLLSGYFDSNESFIIGDLGEFFTKPLNLHQKNQFAAAVASTNFKNLELIQVILNAFGIRSCIEKYVYNPETNPYFAKHVLCISKSSMARFNEMIILQNQNNIEKINEILQDSNDWPDRDNFIDYVSHITSDGVEDVYDCTVPAKSAFDANGVYVHNCVEIGLYPIDITTGESGWEACNLCEINGKLCNTEEDFEIACRAAAIIGTCQAGYSDLKYLGKTSKNIIDREALLGVSITGMMDNPEILFNPEIQRKMAKVVLDVNQVIAAKIGINPTARGLCIKPAGTTSCKLGTSSGIHPHHAKRYIRRSQANYLEAPLRHFKKINPKAVEKSVWSANGTDEVVAFCITVPDNAFTKNDIDALKLLDYVKLTQENWVLAGTRIDRCTQPWLTHNVSNTITVREDEWQAVIDKIYDNRKFYCGISLLPSSGDRDYPQAPFTAVYTNFEIVEMYGQDAWAASPAMIESGLAAFDNNLWSACSDLLMGPENLANPLDSSFDEEKLAAWEKKILWINSAIKFAENYFDGDIRKMTYCLKDVYNWNYWNILMDEYKDVDYSEMIEEEDTTKQMQEWACSGGKCDQQFA